MFTEFYLLNSCQFSSNMNFNQNMNFSQSLKGIIKELEEKIETLKEDIESLQTIEKDEGTDLSNVIKERRDLIAKYKIDRKTLKDEKKALKKAEKNAEDKKDKKNKKDKKDKKKGAEAVEKSKEDAKKVAMKTAVEAAIKKAKEVEEAKKNAKKDKDGNCIIVQPFDTKIHDTRSKRYGFAKAVDTSCVIPCCQHGPCVLDMKDCMFQCSKKALKEADAKVAEEKSKKASEKKPEKTEKILTVDELIEKEYGKPNSRSEPKSRSEFKSRPELKSEDLEWANLDDNKECEDDTFDMFLNKSVSNTQDDFPQEGQSKNASQKPFQKKETAVAAKSGKSKDKKNKKNGKK